MTTTMLAYFPSPAQGVWHLGPVPIRAYAVCIIIGIVVALLLGDRRWAARGGERGVIYDIALWAVPFGLIGGRLYHVLTDWKTYFGPGGAGPVAALRIMDGGLGIWGAVALGGVGAWIACRRRGIPLPAFGDAIAPGIVLAQAIGRVGNYFNQELYGRETTVPWGMQIFYRQDPSGIVDVHSLNGVSTGQVAAVVHPTFLYELLWNLLVFVILIVVDRRRKIGHGRLFALYVALYCVGRFAVELLRDDTATHIAGIRINLFTSTFVFLGAVVYLILAKKGREDPSTLGGHHRVVEPSDDVPELSPELAKEFSMVAAGTGVVAAATVAGLEDEEDHPSGEAGEYFDDESETADDLVALDAVASDESDIEESDLDLLDSADESESIDEFEPLDESEDEVEEAAPEEPAEDEAVVEAEVASTGVAVETDDEAEEEVIDEYHDPIDGDELEGLTGDDTVAEGPVSEQEEELRVADAEEPEDEESDAEELDAEELDEEELDAEEPDEEELDEEEPSEEYADATMVIRYSSDETVDTGATVIYASAEDSTVSEEDFESAEPEAVEAVAAEQADEEQPADSVDSTVAEAGADEAQADEAQADEAQVEVEAVDAPETETPRPSRRGRLFRRRR
ncbi:MAG TPA: prolipoprotein diacylglyceryl transferase [Mycobacterium sp.]|nr:prolipoprotein diacylglyceryl transferase [Mycobacterium sp.]